ncbi:Zn-ribbon domain-containing OB-fold protein [Rhodococcus sp. NPDC127530]|uniref:Zn-ribbon domain-containing OB-fold protein n=1 Tax=unclassified Rhodococcus (in: high G+C Gram-positive bacteria) TaxID=192944 RepID=UPI00362F9A34
MTTDGMTRWQGLAQKCELMIQRCLNCTTLLAPLMATCSACQGSNLERVPSCGVGSIVSSKVVHREVNEADRGLVPCTIAIVELDEGPWVYTWIDGDVPAPSDCPVRVEFRPASRSEQLPVFAVRSAGQR